MGLISTIRSYCQPLRWLSITTLVLLMSANVHAELASYDIQYRNAEAVATQLRQLYPEQNIKITASGQKLLVRADQNIQQEIEQVINNLDVAPVQYRITLSANQGGGADLSGWNLSTRERNSGTQAQVTVTSKHYSTRGGSRPSVVVANGESAAIRGGQLVPVRTGSVGLYGAQTDIDYVDLTRGMIVTPRSHGDNQVALDIVTHDRQQGKVENRRIDTQSISTRRIVPLNTWVSLGGMDSSTQSSSGGITYSTRGKQNAQQSYQIMVEKVSP